MKIVTKSEWLGHIGEGMSRENAGSFTVEVSDNPPCVYVSMGLNESDIENDAMRFKIEDFKKLAEMLHVFLTGD